MRRGASAGRRAAAMTAYSGIFCGLSVCVMLLGGVIPVATYAAPLLASVFLVPLRDEFGRPCAWTCWGAVTLLALLLGLDREAALFYAFTGFWPIVREDLNARVRPGPARFILKTGIFVLMIGAMYSLLCLVLRVDAVVSEFGEMGTAMTGAFLVLLCLCLHLYDRVLGFIALRYRKKLRPKLPMIR